MPTFSFAVLMTLLVILGVSLATFFLLVRRWTTQRQWVTLAEWARQRGFRFGPTEISALPGALDKLRASNVQMRLHLCDTEQSVAAVQLQTDPQASGIGAEPVRWNVLVRRRPVRQSAPAGLRPANAAASLLDLFGLSQFPNLKLGHRFAVLATSSSAARALADSASRTLLPADIGLLVIDEWIVLDFSTRPFDPVELDRMLAVAQQLSQML
jgi:hypothetical protein